MKKFIEKQIQTRDKDLKYAFLPSMNEIIERPANTVAVVILVLLIATFISAVLWAALYHIDVCVSVEGKSFVDGEEFLFKAYVQDEEIFRIKEGDAVKVMIGAYDDTDYEVMNAIVKKIDAQPSVYETIGTVFQIEVLITDRPEKMISGLDGRCDIVTGKRTVLDYFLEPFKKGLGNSLKER